ncbi:MAG: XRE family transcriptional regulator [Actinobacteria bacterium]|nr:XRE family transcriptional regulator [Actinomycetota bacterium]
MTLTSDVHATSHDAEPEATERISTAPKRRAPDLDRAVEFWPTSAIRSALENDDLTVWQRIATAIKRDPYGRTARQVEEVLEVVRPYGVSKALGEVLHRTREKLEASERAEVARQVRGLLNRSGLGRQEFASRIGVPIEEFDAYLSGRTSPSASLMIRICRLSERFAKIRAQRGDAG